MAANSGKRNFVINSVGDTTTISILGAIGDLWFEDGYTMQDAKRDLQAVKTPKINLVISSLGGKVSDALAIHDLIKDFDAEVTTQMLGAVASAGTFVGQAADKGKVTMSTNARHLIHNAMDMAVGNAKELRKAAADLDSFDDAIVAIYMDRIGDKKTETEVRDLMSKEEWIDSSTAQEWGFVDEVFTPGKESTAIDCYDCNLINAHKAFPNIDEEPKKEPAQTNTNKTIMDAFNAKFKTLTDAVNKTLGIKNTQPDPPAPDNTEIQNMVAALQTDMQALTTANQALTNQLTDKTTEYDKIYADYKKLAVATATKTEIEEIDAEIDANAEDKDQNKKASNDNAAVLREG